MRKIHSICTKSVAERWGCTAAKIAPTSLHTTKYSPLKKHNQAQIHIVMDCTDCQLLYTLFLYLNLNHIVQTRLQNAWEINLRQFRYVWYDGLVLRIHAWKHVLHISFVFTVWLQSDMFHDHEKCGVKRSLGFVRQIFSLRYSVIQLEWCRMSSWQCHGRCKIILTCFFALVVRAMEVQTSHHRPRTLIEVNLHPLPG